MPTEAKGYMTAQGVFYETYETASHAETLGILKEQMAKSIYLSRTDTDDVVHFIQEYPELVINYAIAYNRLSAIKHLEEEPIIVEDTDSATDTEQRTVEETNERSPDQRLSGGNSSGSDSAEMPDLPF